MKLYFKGEEQSLQDILRSRDLRSEYQHYLINKYRNTLVSYKLNIPGPIKYSPLIKDIFDEGLSIYKKELEKASIYIEYEKIIYKNSGPEYFGILKISADVTKKLCTNIEDTHPLGRLYDFDVINSSGKQLSREEFGIKCRICLLCNNSGFECGRNRSHDITALINKIESMAVEYFTDHNKGK